jgi:hypothetical protein
MVSMPHPPYSPSLAPSDIYLFLGVKARLDHSGITDEDQSFEELHIILKSIPREELEKFLRLGKSAFRMSIKATEATLTNK